MKDNIDRYDFDSVHIYHKTNNMNMDLFMFGGNELGLLMWYGDLISAKAGWSKQIDAWKQIHTLVANGERQINEYMYESNEILFAAGALLTAGETSMLHELCSLTFAGSL